SLSTVFERPFLQRPQEFYIIHEPINLISCAYVTKNFDFLNQIPLPKPTDPITFVHHFSPTLNKILAPHYYNDDKTHFCEGSFWLKESRFLYDLIKNITEEEIVLVDADDLLREPEKILRKYCEMVNVEFKKEILKWKEERSNIWDLKLLGPNIDYLWHKNIMQSTGFDKSISNDEEIEYPQYVYDLIAKSKPYYEY
ncbi:31676_t:CDS:2, partial [Racocetra persica]